MIATRHKLTRGHNLVIATLVAGLFIPRMVYSEFTEIIPGEEEMAKLKRGEVLAGRVNSDDKQGAATIRALMDTTAKSVWEVIVSCELAGVYVDGLEYCEVLESRPDYARTRQVVDKGWSSPRLDFIFEAFREPYRSMKFQLVEGNLKQMEGQWQLEQLPEGLLVTHEIRVKPEYPVPRWLLRRIMMRGTSDLVACIRALAGGSGAPEARAVDLDRCPGDPAPDDSG
jgi:hypothetical protein